MSAWVVCKEHIDLIVKVAVSGPRDAVDPRNWYRPGYPSGGTLMPDEIGQALWNANHANVGHLYAKNHPEDDYEPEPYTYTDPGYCMTVVEAIKAVHCLNYQCSDLPTWERSGPESWLRGIESSLLQQLPGMEQAPWGWDRDGLRDARNKLARPAVRAVR